MKNRLIAVLATAVATLFLVATAVEQADAQRGGRDGARSAGPRSMGPGGGPRFRGGGPSAGPRFDGGRRSGRRFDGRGPPGRSFSREGSRSYGYAPRYDRRDGRRGRHFRARPFLYGAVPFYGAYVYGPCAYYYRRASATGSSYWWRRYRECAAEYD